MGLLSGIPAAWWAHICIGFRVIYGRWETAGQECAISAPPPIPSHAAGGIAGQV